MLLLLLHVVSSGALLATAALPPDEAACAGYCRAELLAMMLKPGVGWTRGVCFPLALDKALGQQPAPLSPAEMALLLCRLLLSPGGADLCPGGLPAGTGAETREPCCAGTCCSRVT